MLSPCACEVVGAAPGGSNLSPCACEAEAMAIICLTTDTNLFSSYTERLGKRSNTKNLNAVKITELSISRANSVLMEPKSEFCRC